MDNSVQIQLNLIVFGAVLGAILSLVATAIMFWLERKSSEQIRKKEKENYIIGQVLQFLFKANDILNDLKVNKELLEKVKKEFPQNAQQFETQLFKKFNENIGNFFKELMFHSGQLKRLRNKSFWEEFEKLNVIFHDLVRTMTDLKPQKEYEEIDKKYKELMKKFVEKSIKTIEI